MLEEIQAFCVVALVDHTDGRSGTEFRPVVGLAEPLQIRAQKCVHGGSAMHNGVSHHGCIVCDSIARFQFILLQHEAMLKQLSSKP